MTERFIADVHEALGLNHSYCFPHHVNGKKEEHDQSKCSHRFRKNHDFQLTLPIKPHHRYIVLLRRNIVRQVEAYGRFLHKPPIVVAREKGDYLRKFKRKWIKSKRNNVRVVFYEDIINRPKKEFSRILSFAFQRPLSRLVSRVLNERKEKIRPSGNSINLSISQQKLIQTIVNI